MAMKPSMNYVSTRTRYMRRVYFAVTVVLVMIVAIIILYRLSDSEQDQESQPSKPVVVQPEPEPEPVIAEEPPRFTMPINVSSESPVIAETAPVVIEQPTVLSDNNTAMPAVAGRGRASAVIAEAVKLIDSPTPQIIKAREILNDLLGTELADSQRNYVKMQLSSLTDKWLLNPKIYHNDKLCGTYKVQSGDYLSTIGKTYSVPWEFLLKINKMVRAESLRSGQVLKVANGPFHVKVDRSTFTMDVYLQDTFVKSFPVGLGKPGYETPTGLWLVEPGGKLIKPRWTDEDTGRTYEADDPDYPLGSRWIRLRGIEGEAVGREGFAIHGTKDPDEIGTARSRGCIRLHNGNAILVYDMLMPGKSKVVVAD